MTEQASQVNENIECSMCGKVGGPVSECELCHGNRGFVQSRAYTRTEEQQGAKNDPDRYSRTGNVSPKVVLVPGGFDPTVPEKKN